MIQADPQSGFLAGYPHPDSHFFHHKSSRRPNTYIAPYDFFPLISRLNTDLDNIRESQPGAWLDHLVRPGARVGANQ